MSMVFSTQALLLLAARTGAQAQFYSYDIVKEYPHDHRAFTQGDAGRGVSVALHPRTCRLEARVDGRDAGDTDSGRKRSSRGVALSPMASGCGGAMSKPSCACLGANPAIQGSSTSTRARSR